MPGYLLLAFLATLGFGLAAVLQKYGISRNIASPAAVQKKPGISGKLTALLRMLSNPIWLTGVVLQLLSAIMFFQALSMGDITIVQPLVNLNFAVAALLGVFILDEKLGRTEYVSILFFICGALAIALGVSGAGRSMYSSDSLVVMTVSFVALSLLLTILPLFTRLEREIGLAAASGLMFGLGTAFMKIMSLKLMNAGHEFNAASPLTWLAMFFDWLFIVFALASVAGFSLAQAAFACGRVAVVMPVVTVFSMSAPLAAGFFILDETLNVARMIGIAFIACGSIILAFKKSERKI